MTFTYTDILINNRGWTIDQMITRICLQKASATISIIASAYVIRDIWKDEQKRKESSYHQLMIGLSVVDILVSFTVHFLTTWPMPKGSHVWAMGTVWTCDVVAFVANWTPTVAPFYNCSLSTFYFIQLKLNWTDRRMKLAFRWLHVIPWLVGLVPTLTTVSTRYTGPDYELFICGSTFGYPPACQVDEVNMDCIRGGGYQIPIVLGYMVVCAYAFSIIYSFVVMFLVYRHLRQIERKAERYTFAAFTLSCREKQMKRSRRVMIQGFLYATTLFPVFLSMTLWMIVPSIYDGIFMRYTVGVLIPLQGLFNALIYCIPVFRKWLEQKRKERQKEYDNNEQKNHLSSSLFHGKKINSSNTPAITLNNERKDVIDTTSSSAMLVTPTIGKVDNECEETFHPQKSNGEDENVENGENEHDRELVTSIQQDKNELTNDIDPNNESFLLDETRVLRQDYDSNPNVKIDSSNYAGGKSSSISLEKYDELLSGHSFDRDMNQENLNTNIKSMLGHEISSCDSDSNEDDYLYLSKSMRQLHTSTI